MESILYTRGRYYPAYTPQEAREKGIEWAEDYENVKAGDYIKTADNYIIEVIKRKNFSKGCHIVQIASGTWNFLHEDVYATRIKADRHSLSGKYRYNRVKDNVANKRRLKIFVYNFLKTGTPEEAFRVAFPDAGENNVKNLSSALMRNKEVKKMINDEVKRVLESNGITKDYLIQNLKELFENEKLNVHARMSALKELIDISDIKDKAKVSREQRTFQGFSDRDIGRVEATETHTQISNE